MSKFWWGHGNDNKKNHWTTMEVSKERGGLGVRHIDNFNKAMLAKQIWWILTQPSSLVVWIMKEGELLKAKFGYCSSFIWRSLWSVIELVKKGIKWRVGDEKNICIWKDNCVSTLPSGRIHSQVKCLPESEKVSLLLNKNSKTWYKEYADFSYIHS